MNKKLILNNSRCVTQSLWLENENRATRLFICASGYEKRNIHWVSRVLDKYPPGRDNLYLVVGFEDYPEALSRPANDRFYEEQRLNIDIIHSSSQTGFIELVKDKVVESIKSSGSEPVEIHVDYSCMPRSWYCFVPSILEDFMRSNDQGFLWYSPGEYPDTVYPTAGVQDFRLFSGKASLSPRFRTHLFGLGFDRIRSQAIWSVLDPEHLICFYADPPRIAEYVNKVRSDNEDVLRASNNVLTLPLTDVSIAIDKIAAVVREFLRLGDVVIVPDGPKPLILAASLIPSLIEKTGVVCFHVARRKNDDFKPIDVIPVGEPTGLVFSGR